MMKGRTRRCRFEIISITLSTLEEKQYEGLKNGSEQAKSVLIEQEFAACGTHCAEISGHAGGHRGVAISIGTVGLIKAVSTYNLERRPSWNLLPVVSKMNC